ncbi:uncharacterized protein LY79DRAFT_208468 [Colletotrichum navitas]|uniref:Uncharacterized protein n=1 Tax=Colletotrichum navitas TaxID=681940 RepID=A0AAD8VC33_9PEZI|nr:uncharacterized protein LY79DRAFT_208468 [Colletotrichum navitas]KAK1599105.1 hypothetical protein LY79DRAFT_208468 [Colletotrichum navitas]
MKGGGVGVSAQICIVKLHQSSRHAACGETRAFEPTCQTVRLAFSRARAAGKGMYMLARHSTPGCWEADGPLSCELLYTRSPRQVKTGGRRQSRHLGHFIRTIKHIISCRDFVLGGECEAHAHALALAPMEMPRANQKRCARVRRKRASKQERISEMNDERDSQLLLAPIPAHPAQSPPLPARTGDGSGCGRRTSGCLVGLGPCLSNSSPDFQSLE